MIWIDALYIFAHFLCPVIKDIVLTLSIGIASRLVCKLPRKYGRLILQLSVCIRVRMVQQTVDVILIPALERFVCVEVIFFKSGYAKLLCPLDVLTHTAESVPVVSKGDKQLHTVLFSLI